MRWAPVLRFRFSKICRLEFKKRPFWEGKRVSLIVSLEFKVNEKELQIKKGQLMNSRGAQLEIIADRYKNNINWMLLQSNLT